MQTQSETKMINLENVSDPLTRRVLLFVESKGGPSDVARAIKKKPALFYNLEAGRNKRPSSETLDLLAEAFPDFDPTYMMSGKATEVEGDQVKLLLAMLADRDRQLLDKNTYIEKLEGKLEQYEQTMIDFAKQNFLETSSQTTAIGNLAFLNQDRIEVAGFGREPRPVFAEYIRVALNMIRTNGLMNPRMRDSLGN